MQVKTCLTSLGPFGEVKEELQSSLEKSPSRTRFLPTGFRHIQVGVLFKLSKNTKRVRSLDYMTRIKEHSFAIIYSL